MNTLELMRMARCGEADGHDREWYSLYAKTPRMLKIMHDAADEERRRIVESEQRAYEMCKVEEVEL